MKKIIIASSIILALIVGVVLFYNIPRLEYRYDSSLGGYYVYNAYGNAKSYNIKTEYRGKSVVGIGQRAFMGNDKLEYVYFGNNIKSIDRLAFSGCKNLKEIDLENVSFIGRNAFADCVSLTSVVLNVEDILGSVFYGCINLTDVQINNVVSIGTFAFANTGLKEISIPKSCLSVSNDVFYGCNIEELTIYVYSDVLVNNTYLKTLKKVIFIGEKE